MIKRAISAGLVGAALTVAPSIGLARASLRDCPVNRLDYVDQKSKQVFSVRAYADSWIYATWDETQEEYVFTRREPAKKEDGSARWHKKSGRQVMRGVLEGKPAYLAFEVNGFAMPCCSYGSEVSLSKLERHKELRWYRGERAPSLRDIGFSDPIDEIGDGPLKGMTLMPRRCRQAS